MINYEIQINSYLIDHLHIYFLKAISKSCLIDILLHRIKAQSKCLVLSCDGTPEVENLKERVLLESCK